MKIIYSLFIITTFIILGCGVKGGPYPPFTKSPETVKNVTIKQQDGYLIIYWKYIPKYADGRKMNENFRFEIFTIDHRIIKNIRNKGNLYWFRYKFKDPREYCFRFKVKTSLYESRFSKYFCYIPAINYPNIKPEMNLKIIETGIKIKWNLTKYKTNIYKNNKPEFYPIPSISLKNKEEYIDKQVINNKTYCYYITYEDENGVESQISNQKCITFRDIFPPMPPQNPKLIKKNNKTYLIWSDSPSRDVVGYMIYINNSPLFNKPVKTYIVEIKNYKKDDKIVLYAIDNAGNLSKPVTVK